MDEWFIVTFTDIRGLMTKRIVVQGREQVGQAIAKDFREVDNFDKAGFRAFLEHDASCKFPGAWEGLDVHSRGFGVRARITLVTEPPRFRDGR